MKSAHTPTVNGNLRNFKVSQQSNIRVSVPNHTMSRISSYEFGLYYLDFLHIVYLTLELPKIYFMAQTGQYFVCPWFLIPDDEGIPMQSGHVWLGVHLITAGALLFYISYMYYLRASLDASEYKRQIIDVNDTSRFLQLIALFTIFTRCFVLGNVPTIVAIFINLGLCYVLLTVSSHWPNPNHILLYCFLLTLPSMGSVFFFIRYSIILRKWFTLATFIALVLNQWNWSHRWLKGMTK